MLWLTSWITEHTTHWGLYIDDFWWTAIWAAIVLSVVSWLLSLVVRRRCEKAGNRAAPKRADQACSAAPAGSQCGKGVLLAVATIGYSRSAASR